MNFADTTQYPPEENISDTPCYHCHHYVRAHHGLTFLGYEGNGQTCAVTLHRGCFAEGMRVTRSGYPGVVTGEYMPGVYEVRLDRGAVVVPKEDLQLA